MASEIRANKSTNRAGLGTVTYADTGIIVSGIVTCTELSGLTALNISGVGTASTLDINGDIDVDGHTNLDNVNIAGINTIGAVNQTVYSPHDSNWATRSALTLFGNYGGGLAFNDNNNNGWVQYVSGSGVDFWLKNGAVGGSLATSLKAEKGGSVELYENGTKVFETTSTGVDVTGTAGADALNVTGTSVVANLKSTNNNYVLGLAGNNSSVKSYFGTDSSGNFLLATGSGVDERLRITSSGTVGVNCTPTALPLEVKQQSADGGALRLRDSSAQYRYLEFDVTGALTQITARSNNSHGSIDIGTIDQFGRTTQLYIKGGANAAVGIGTADPQVHLNVFNPTTLGGTASNRQDLARFEGHVSNNGMLEFANVRISDGSDWQTSTFRIQRRIDSTRMGYIDFGTGAGAGSGGAGRDIQFGSGDGVTMMHLDSQGRVGIGTESISSNVKLDVTDGIIRSQAGHTHDTRIEFYRKNTGSLAWIGIPNWSATSLYIYGPTANSNEIAAAYGGGAWNFYTSGGSNAAKLTIDTAGLTTLKNFNGTGLKLEGSGSNFQGMQLQVTDSSSSQTRNVFIDVVNETGAAIANQVGQIQSDGGSYWAWQTQPSGNRNDRRVERLRLDSDGTVILKNTAAATARSDFMGTLRPISQIASTWNAYHSLTRHDSGSSYGPYLMLAKNRNDAYNSNGAVQDNDELGNISFLGNDGTAFREGARIRGEVEGTPGSSQVPTALTFATNAGSGVVERVRITKSGNVVVNNSNIDFNTAGTGIFYNPGSNDAAGITFNSNELRFYTQNTQRFSLDTGGSLRLKQNMFIRTNAPTIYLQDTDHHAAMIHQNSGLFYVLRASGTDSTNWVQYNNQWPLYIRMDNNNAYFGANVYSAGTLLTGSSDSRLKKNLVKIQTPLEKISKLTGYNFDWNDNVTELGFTPDIPTNDVGLIAQDVQEVAPQAVQHAPFDQVYDKETKLQKSKSGEKYLTVQYEKLVPLLVEAIKELKAEVDDLKSS